MPATFMVRLNLSADEYEREGHKQGCGKMSTCPNENEEIPAERLRANKKSSIRNYRLIQGNLTRIVFVLSGSAENPCQTSGNDMIRSHFPYKNCCT